MQETQLPFEIYNERAFKSDLFEIIYIYPYDLPYCLKSRMRKKIITFSIANIITLNLFLRSFLLLISNFTFYSLLVRVKYLLQAKPFCVLFILFIFENMTDVAYARLRGF